MSSRERWIVYPLLFLTLGLTMRSRLGPPPDHDQVYFSNIHYHRLIHDVQPGDFQPRPTPQPQLPPRLTPQEESAN